MKFFATGTSFLEECTVPNVLKVVLGFMVVHTTIGVWVQMWAGYPLVWRIYADHMGSLVGTGSLWGSSEAVLVFILSLISFVLNFAVPALWAFVLFRLLFKKRASASDTPGVKVV